MRARFITRVREKLAIDTDVWERRVGFLSNIHAREIFLLRKISAERPIIEKYDYRQFPNGERSTVTRDKFLHNSPRPSSVCE